MNDSYAKNSVHARRAFAGSRSVAGIAGWVALCTVFFSRELAADSIVKVNGTTIDDVTITAAKWEVVQYQIANRPQSIPAAQVASIHRTTVNNDLKRGRRALKNGDYATAVERLGSVARAAKDWEQAEAAYLLARAHREGGDFKAADDELKAYLNKYVKAKDWWVPRAIYDRGTVRIALKRYETAEGSFKKLEEMPGQWPARAQVGRARAIEAAKNSAKYTQALQMLLSVARRRSAPLELRHEAYVVRGRIILRQKQYDRAIKELTEVFFNPAKAREYHYDAQRAEATYLMGRAYLGRGGKKNLEEAELWLLRVPALYPNRGRVYTLCCRALAIVYNGLGNKKRAAEWKRRAE